MTSLLEIIIGGAIVGGLLLLVLVLLAWWWCCVRRAAASVEQEGGSQEIAIVIHDQPETPTKPATLYPVASPIDPSRTQAWNEVEPQGQQPGAEQPQQQPIEAFSSTAEGAVAPAAAPKKKKGKKKEGAPKPDRESAANAQAAPLAYGAGEQALIDTARSGKTLRFKEGKGK
jgi:hypothetical protein